MTNTILTDKQRRAAVAHLFSGAQRDEDFNLSRPEYEAIESATLAALVQRAGVEEVAWRAANWSHDNSEQPWLYRDKDEPFYPESAGQLLYPPEAIAKLQARIEALSAEVERLKNNPRQSAFGKESEKLADDYLTLSRAFNELLAERDQLRAKLEQAVANRLIACGDLERQTEWNAQLRAQLEAQGEAVGWFDKGLNNIRWRDGLVNGDFVDKQAFYTHPAPAAPNEEQFCYCNKDVSLQMVSGGAAPEGYLGRVTLRIGDQYRDYFTHLEGGQELNAIHAVVLDIGGDWPEVEGDSYTLHHVKRMARELTAFIRTAPAAPVVELTDEQQQERFDRWYNRFFRNQTVDNNRLSQCEASWFAALHQTKTKGE